MDQVIVGLMFISFLGFSFAAVIVKMLQMDIEEKRAIANTEPSDKLIFKRAQEKGVAEIVALRKKMEARYNAAI